MIFEQILGEAKELEKAVERNENENKRTCSICGQVMVEEFGNNAQPVNNGICCDYCNAMVVIPARIKLAYKLKSNIKNEKGSN